MEIISQLFDVLLKKRAPENVSYSINAMIVACTLTVLGQYYLLSLESVFTQPLLYSVILTASEIMAYALLLKLHKKENRLVQTLTIVLGINFIIMAIISLFTHIPALGILNLALLFYGFIVTVNVLKSSFDCPTYLSVVILISVSVFSHLMLVVVAPSVKDEIILQFERNIEEMPASNHQTA